MQITLHILNFKFMNIEIDQAYLPTLYDYASRDGVTPEVWAQRKIESVLTSLIKNTIVSNINVLKGDALMAMNSSFESTLVAIRKSEEGPLIEDPNFPNVV